MLRGNHDKKGTNRKCQSLKALGTTHILPVHFRIYSPLPSISLIMAFPPPLWPSRLFDQSFGMCITPHDFLFPFYNTYSNYYRLWKTTQNVVEDFGSTINNEKESFKVTLDVKHFRPNELSVKVANNQIVVEGRHEERKDEHGFISRHFTRRYDLPHNCMPEDVISNLSSDGVLTVVANKKPKELPKNEKIVPIKLCKSCPVKEDVASSTKTVVNTDQKDKAAEFKNVDASKKNTQIMLKEDHCCLLLKPELLREAVSDSSEIVVEKEKDRVEEDKLKDCQASKNTSEMLEQTFAKANPTVVSGEKCDKTAKSKSEVVEQKNYKSKATMSKSDEKTKASAAISTSGQIFEQRFAKSNMAMSESEEKFDLFDNASAASSTSEKICEKSSAVMSTLSEKASQSKMTKSEISEITSLSSKTSENIESLTSFKASTASNIEEISEELSDFVSDILCSELDKTLDIKK